MAKPTIATDFKIDLISLGSPAIGKSVLLKRYLNQPFVEEYKPTGVEQLATVKKVCNSTARFRFWDIGSSNINIEIVKKILAVCNIFLLCFDITDESTLNYLRTLWTDRIKPFQTKESFICFVGLKSDLKGQVCSIIPQTKIDSVVQEMGFPYVECSSKTMEGLQNIFSNALIFHYHRYLIKTIDPIINNPILNDDVFSNDQFRQVILELYKYQNRTIIQYLSSYNTLNCIVDFFLMDINISSEANGLSQFCGVLFDIKVDSIIKSIVANKSLIDKIFDSFLCKEKFSILNMARQFQLVRLIMWLFDTHYIEMSDYAKQSGLVEKLLLNATDETKYQLLNMILNIEKKVFTKMGKQDRSDSILQGINLTPIFERLLTLDTPAVSLAESIYKLVVMTIGNNCSSILNTFDHQNYALTQMALGLIKSQSTCSEAVSFLGECLFATYGANVTSNNIHPQFISILSSHEQLFQTLISSTSKIVQLSGLKLIHYFLKHKCEQFASPLILSCLDIFFNSQRGNVFHTQILEIIQTVFKLPTPDVSLILLQKGNFAKQILEACENRDQEKLYYGHLYKMAHWLTLSPYGEIDEVIQSERWKVFYETVVVRFMQKELLITENHRQLRNNQVLEPVAHLMGNQAMMGCSRAISTVTNGSHAWEMGPSGEA